MVRSLAVLELFSPERAWLSLAEIARETNLSTATALRHVATLAEAGFLERSPVTGKFRPGLAVLRLGFTALSSEGLRELARIRLERLAETLGETVNMAVLVGVDIVYIERIRRQELVTASIHVGSRLPAHCTSMGKALLAELPDAELELRLEGIVLSPTEGKNAITDVLILRRELVRTRERGYAIQDEELMTGLRSVAAPIRDRSGHAVAAINVAVSAGRVSLPELLDEISPQVVVAARDISTAVHLSHDPTIADA